ncbi:MAG: FecR domain-containing protein, partial [Steroidobacteraceae bacterium]
MRTYKANTASGSLQGFLFSGLVLLAGLAAPAGNQASAQDAAASCAPVVARVVSLQGNVEVRRAGMPAWLKVSRLDTSLCAGDRLRTEALSRAALFVQPETLVRVDQNTTISLGQTTDEVLVEFHTDEISQTARSAQACGAGYFITRFPRKFKVTTAHMNAAVEGTEFMVESSCEATKLTVLEGQVLSQSAATQETRLLTAGQRLESGTAIGSAFSTVVRQADAVQWVLRYPPLSDATTKSEIPSEAECQALPETSRTTCLTELAEGLLRLGRVDESLK